jgi:hypothetical protein
MGVTETTPQIQLSMSLEEARRLSGVLLEVRGSERQAMLHEALWLRTVLIEQWRRTPIAERARFERRADSIFARLLGIRGDAVPSAAADSVGRDDAC